MVKVGKEPIRRRALVNAAIDAVGARGLDVTVAQIAREAGMSTALAHHYFGTKTQIFEGAMRRILDDYRSSVRAGLAAGGDRVEAIVAAGFGPANFRPLAVSAWLVFYVEAQQADWARRLLRIYQRRLRSNLAHALRAEGHPAPGLAAETMGALIDGLYLRAALGETTDAGTATARVLAVGRTVR